MQGGYSVSGSIPLSNPGSIRVSAEDQGLATYRWNGPDAELVTLNAVPAGVGAGSALIEALVARLRAEACTRLWVTTTNDNLSALRFYLRRGFRLAEVRPGAIDEARKLKPSISTVGQHGIPLHDEIELCRMLDPHEQISASTRSPWSWPERRGATELLLAGLWKSFRWSTRR